MPFVLRYFRNFFRKVRLKINPTKYAKSLGVTMGSNVRFYGPTLETFSTEPWLISIGSGAHITGGFILLLMMRVLLQ